MADVGASLTPKIVAAVDGSLLTIINIYFSTVQAMHNRHTIALVVH